MEVREALRLYHTLLWEIRINLDDINFILDSKKVVDYFQRCSVYIIEFGSIMNDCKQLCNLFFQNSHVEFSWKQVNGLSHALAK